MRRAWWLVLGLGACGPKTDLDPLPGSARVPGMKEGVLVDDGPIRVVLQTSHWPGPTPIQQLVTPVRVLIENNSCDPVQVQYANFALRTAGGEILNAIPPFRVTGTVEESLSGVPAVVTPAFTWSGFQVAPYYGSLYPSLQPWGGGFAWDPLYYRTYGAYWVDIPLPSPDMLAGALPEGVIEPGGHVDGWLYFPGLDRDLETVTLQASLTSPDTCGDVEQFQVVYDVD
jgi:hypothetical protein